MCCVQICVCPLLNFLMLCPVKHIASKQTLLIYLKGLYRHFGACLVVNQRFAKLSRTQKNLLPTPVYFKQKCSSFQRNYAIIFHRCKIILGDNDRHKCDSGYIIRSHL
jgi:hypothetical protein